MTKVCTICGQEKDIDQFNFKNKAEGKRNSACKECTRNQTQKHYKQNTSYYSERNRNNKAELRAWIKEYKSKLKCERCGEDHIACLDFHHMDPTQKDMPVSALINYYSLNRIKAEIEKCIVLCANCHRKEHYNQNVGV